MNSQAWYKFIEGASFHVLSFWYVSFKTHGSCQNHLKLREENTPFHNYLVLFEGIAQLLRIKNIMWIGGKNCIKFVFGLR